MRRPLLPSLLLALAATPVTPTQVHYHPDGHPWKQTTDHGPDREVPGWYYNLGITGLRVELLDAAKTCLAVRYVFEDSPAWRRVEVDDRIVGAFGKPFRTEHRNGYGMQVFGPEGPILEFANALEHAQSKAGKGRLPLLLERDGERVEVELAIPRDSGVYAKTFPEDCTKTARILAEILPWLAEQQRDDGSWGSPPHDLFAPLALLANNPQKYRRELKACARFHAGNTSTEREAGGLINWRYAAAGIFLSEYHLATGENWVVAELQEIHDFLVWSQYTDPAQINPKSRETHPDAVPRDGEQHHGGWGHNPGFEGYGPIAMLTGQGALAFALMQRCGVKVDRELHDAAYAFLARGTGKNGYVWYSDEVASDRDYADMGRTGAAGLANLLSPYGDRVYRDRALAHARCIGEHPLSFPDTHGSPTMGMALAAMAAAADPRSFRALMDANRWWFTLSRCPDGTFYYQPNRDNAGYGGDSRLSATAVTALIFSIPRRSLHVTGKPFGD